MTLLDNWISGFINGEGSFSVLPKRVFVFYIEHTDKDVLELIRKRMQFGPNVRFRARRQEGRKDTYVLSISSRKDLESLIKFFRNDQIISLQVFLEMEFHHFKKTREEDKLSLKIGYFLFCTDYFDYLIIAA